MGYPIEGVEVEGADGAAAEQPIAVYLAAADASKGEAVFKKCAACHNADQGGAHALGPNLFGIMGAPLAAKPGYAYSEPLKSKGGTWTWDAMSAWLKNPKSFAQGTKMTFAGLSKPEDRANVMLWMNGKGSNVPLPAAPPPGAPAGEPKDNAAPKAGTGPAPGPQQGETEPVLTEQQTGTNSKNVGGEGAAKLTGPGSEAERRN
jgi:cytochrome c